MMIENLSNKMRKVILEASFRSGHPAHIGGALSIVDILSVLYAKVMNINMKNPKDRFILSKGHGFLGLLSVLHCKGFISKKIISTFQKNGSEIIAHPIENKKLGIESSNGSLGQGLSFGIGLAIAYKKKKKTGNIYVLIGDGECYEGSIWESAITATEQKLDNLFLIVDSNGYQNDGAIASEMNSKNLYKKWRGFGWNVLRCDGHNITQLKKNFLTKKKKFQPTVLIAKTLKGKGVKFMENNNDWHHGRLTKELYKKALNELRKI